MACSTHGRWEHCGKRRRQNVTHVDIRLSTTEEGDISGGTRQQGTRVSVKDGEELSQSGVPHVKVVHREQEDERFVVAPWVTRRTTVDWVCFKTQALLVTLRTLNQPRGKCFCIFGSRSFVRMSGMCQKQTSVSHSSTESEIISSDAGLRMDGILALDLWDVVIEVLKSATFFDEHTHIKH